MDVYSNTYLYKTLSVTGATTLSSTLSVTGAATLNSTLNAKGTVDIGTVPSVLPSGSNNKKLRVWGVSFFQGAIVLSNGANYVTLSISQDGYLEVDGDMYATGFITAGQTN